MNMNFPEIYSATGMMELIQQIGFLPLLDSGIEGFSAEDIVAEDCGYVRLLEGGWDWPCLLYTSMWLRQPDIWRNCRGISLT